jgi:hypothetical protein
MTLFELIDEVFEKTHVDREEILSRVRAAWPGRVNGFTPTQCALMVRALSAATPTPVRPAPLWKM